MGWILKQRFNKGQQAEAEALSFLQHQGLRLLTKNYAWRGGELDLIMTEQDTIVFVEVRQRSSSRYGTAEESLDQRKCHRLINCAQHYLQHHNMTNKACRFDVLAANGKADSQGFHFEWIKNAITL
ncbi:YraN family protein [Aestuariirhabdus sp. Z084]|uniref:YraN family protein n=1 Tax=Aestuariirhabdus haliotis TaxID=2918751 RepID=UPI00201B4534|nr:YraN family protein [Aestuariirhabdus haliotis]MCL6415923.1 YraN family protein [Aestuariirhabdus haliotis]MCL6419921.1 YraN family protein [Aestuariirhabdus haliotis]